MPPLEDGEVAFDGVGMGVATHVFLGTVVDGLMFGELATEPHVEPALVGHKTAFAAHVLANDGCHTRDACMVHMEGTNLSTTLYEAKNGTFVSSWRRRFSSGDRESDSPPSR